MSADQSPSSHTVEQLLLNRGVRDVDAFGWLDETEIDPEFTGYAMWALDPPYDHDFDAWQYDKPPRRSPNDRERKLMELGHDFFGLMKTSRYFIGHALRLQSSVGPHRIEATEFDCNDFAALVALIAAADRLSDFVIITALGAKTNEPAERNKAYDALRKGALSSEADALAEGFKAMAKARDARRVAVHGLATQPARVQQQLLKAEAQAVRDGRWPHRSDADASYESVMQQVQETEREELAQVEARARLLCECYATLIKMGELAFRVENVWRRRRSP